MTIYRQETPPDQASAEDVFVDQADEDKIYVVSAAIDMLAQEFEISEDYRSGAIPLLVSSKDGTFSTLKIVRAGSTGTPTLVNASGTGTEADPFVYTLNLYDNTNSNDAIIAATANDTHLVFSGEDEIAATVSTVEGTTNMRRSYIGRNAFVDLLGKDSSMALYTRPKKDLRFTSKKIGNIGNFIRVVATRAGATGTSTLVISGSQTKNDPLIYTFALYDDNDSNADIAALLASDPLLACDGEDTTTSEDQSIQARAFTATLDNGVGASLGLKTIHIVYAADAPSIGINDAIPAHIPNVLKNALAEYLAGRLASAMDGGNLNKARTWRETFVNALLKARAARTSQTYPDGMRPA